MGSSLTTRPATGEDFDFLYHLHWEVFYPYANQLWGWDEIRLEADFRAEFESPDRQVILLNQVGAIGSWVVEDHEEFLFLDYLVISPHYQGKGLGTAMINQLLEDGARQGKPVRLHVLKLNPAVRLYERLGFRRIGEDEYRFTMEAGDLPVSFSEPGGPSDPYPTIPK